MDIRKALNSDTAINVALWGSVAGAGVGATKVVHIVNHTSEYNPIQNQILGLEQDNSSISADLHDSHLQGFSGAVAVRNHLIGLQKGNDTKISTLEAKEPKQIIGQIPEVAIEAGSALLVGVAVFTLLARRSMKVSRHAKTARAQA